MKRWIPFVKSDPLVAVVRMQGVIASGARGTLSDQALAPVIERAFSRGKPDAVALVLSSPGGSPVQSSLIGMRIRRLAEEKKVPVYAFVEDVAASGGYWIAAAADEIFADASSIIGSIGVISSSFGAHQFIERYGIERRVYTAGESKSQLDPFKPEKPEDVERLKGILDDLHLNFIDHVKGRRGDKLNGETELFNGEFWLAGRAKELGLIDEIGHLKPVMQDKFGEKVKFRVYGLRRPLWARLGAQFAADGVAMLEERAAYAQFGL